MINLSTPPKEILEIMKEDMPRVKFYALRPYGSKRKYKRLEDKLLDKALLEQKSVQSEIQEYISPSGNRWIMYIQIDYYPEALYAQAQHIHFIYYETYGSCGAFFPLYPLGTKPDSNRKPGGLAIYTSHFFLRFAERTGIQYRSKELIREFISSRMTPCFQVDEENNVIVKFKGGYGFGKLREEDSTVMEVRTFLREEELNNKQRKLVDKLNAYYTTLKDGNHLKEAALSKALLLAQNPDKMAEEYQQLKNAYAKLNLSYERELFGFYSLALVRILESHFNTKFTIEQYIYIIHTAAEPIWKFTLKYGNYKERQDKDKANLEFIEDFIKLALESCKLLNFKSVTEESLRRVLELINDKTLC